MSEMGSSMNSIFGTLAKDMSLLGSSIKEKGEELIGSNPIGEAIHKAVSEDNIGTDWGLNLEICDLINQSPSEGPVKAVRTLRKHLRSENPKVVQLTLTLCEACAKNCGAHLHLAFANRDFLKDITASADGSKGSEARLQTLRLIKEWALAFKDDYSLRGFVDVYEGLLLRGVVFPEVDGAPIVLPPMPPTQSRRQGQGQRQQAAQGAGAESEQQALLSPEEELKKLTEDLQAVKERVELCQQMMGESPGVERDPVLAEVVGYLHACKPRMVDIIQAGMSGNDRYIGADVLEGTLKVNDSLLRTLKAEEEGTPIEVEKFELDFTASLAAATAGAAAASTTGAGAGAGAAVTGSESGDGGDDLLSFGGQAEEAADGGGKPSFTIDGNYDDVDDDEEEEGGLVRRGSPPVPAEEEVVAAVAAAEKEEKKVVVDEVEGGGGAEKSSSAAAASDPFDEFAELMKETEDVSLGGSGAGQDEDPFAHVEGPGTKADTEVGVAAAASSATADDDVDFDSFLASMEKSDKKDSAGKPTA